MRNKNGTIICFHTYRPVSTTDNNSVVTKAWTKVTRRFCTCALLKEGHNTMKLAVIFMVQGLLTNEEIFKIYTEIKFFECCQRWRTCKAIRSQERTFFYLSAPKYNAIHKYRNYFIDT